MFCQWCRFKHQTKHLTAYLETLQPGERLILVRPTGLGLAMHMCSAAQACFRRLDVCTRLQGDEGS